MLQLIAADSGKPLPSKQVSLALRADPEHACMHIGTGGERDFLIPPKQDGSKGVLVNLLPGEQQTIKVPLRKLP